MSRTILFSPIGGTDPISYTNYQDGALLHICRVYQPDQIYLYMTKYILDTEKEDNRYIYCLEKLYEKIGKKLVYEKIEKPDLEEVQDFDWFYDEYTKEFMRMRGNLRPDDRLIINVSSGTPAMKSALLILVSSGMIDAEIIQVVTPNRTINEHAHPEKYEVEALWELNPDNQDGFENRCRKIHCLSLIAMQTEKEVKRLIQAYDYNAAYETAKLIPDRYACVYRPAIEYAKHRLMLDLRRADQIAKDNQIPSFLAEKIPEQRKIVEYALLWQMKLTKGEYADFLRSFTPLFLDLLVQIIKTETKEDVYEYCTRDKGYKWDISLMKSNKKTAKWLGALNFKYTRGFESGFVKSDHLVCIIRDSTGNEELQRCVDILRRVEEKIRNTAAHEISTITNERIKQDTGYSSEEIVDCVKKAFTFTSINLSKNDWKSYERMNEYILEKIRRE